MVRTNRPDDTPTPRGCEHADVRGDCGISARWRLGWTRSNMNTHLNLCNTHADSYAYADTARVLEIDR